MLIPSSIHLLVTNTISQINPDPTPDTNSIADPSTLTAAYDALKIGDFQSLFAILLPILTQVALLLVLLFFAYLIASYAARIVASSMRKTKIDETLTRFFAKSTRWSIMAIAIISVLGYFGISTASFAALIAAAGLAIGLAFQGTLSNFAAGIMLLIFRPYKVNDVITVSGTTGKVFEIELFTTTLDTPDNRRIIVPNASIFGSTIENITYHPTRRVDVAVGTEYTADLEKTRQILLQAASQTNAVLTDPEPAIYLLQLGPSSIDWSVRVWAKTDDYWAVREAITQNVKTALDAADIGIPFPQLDLHLASNAEQLLQPNTSNS
ncbi:Small-conductance mechanosensitive channel [Poriferisphaera corsica]|uniref:Small-conductance mechanosensitive channel n=1 Tax=Poriferisphaera corsica TaxID=2528020 RepID=A0A517YU82_9BACT|nr:mechanosensitive ion channel domain-containing protein [Poriferisphaera corsica]QDU33722.1 Small-conductance mechanosensitive channel [Poriferisphaera corsica]